MCTRGDRAAGRWCGKLHTRPVVDRIGTPQPRTKYKAEGVGLGAYVTSTRAMRPISAYEDSLHTVTGQVWAQASTGRGWWWIVTNASETYVSHESSMTVVGHASEDVPLCFDAS